MPKSLKVCPKSAWVVDPSVKHVTTLGIEPDNAPVRLDVQPRLHLGLQQHFNRSIFKEEMKACEEEGITQVNITFADNEDVLHLIESKARGKPQGLLPMLDEEGRVVGGTDEGFFHKIAKVHKANPRLAFKSPRRGLRTGPHDFWIHHFADHVRYDVRGFVDKNRDILVPDLHELMTRSTNTFIASTLFRSGRRILMQKSNF